MGEKLKEFGMLVFGLVITLAVPLLIFLFIHGGAWLSERLYPWLVRIATFAFGLVVFVLLPLAIFKKTRRFAGGGLIIASITFGATLWVWSLLLTYYIWGAWAVFIGIFIMGIGVVPIAMLATLLNGMWSQLFQLILLLVLTFGIRALGVKFTDALEDEKPTWDQY